MLKAAAITAAALGVGSLVLQRWVAETREAAIALVVAWFALVAVAALVWLRDRPELRRPVLGTLAAVTLGTIAVGYWTGFRDRTVDEEVVTAASRADAAERASGLSAAGSETKSNADDPAGKPKAPQRPVSLAAGDFTGQDGHAGSGRAEIVQSPGGERSLVFTDFDVDPGADVEVYLTPDAAGVDDRVELGGLKGNVGDQQYPIPESADLGRYDSVVLWCTPFTVRIATAELR
ncbi:MAG: DM13 domain-containing protein [Solirubrobacterales bacterium]